MKTLLEIGAFVQATALPMARESLPGEGVTLWVLVIGLLNVGKVTFWKRKNQRRVKLKLHLGKVIFKVVECLAIAFLGTKSFETLLPDVKVRLETKENKNLDRVHSHGACE
jgi:hypothetical protein